MGAMYANKWVVANAATVPAVIPATMKMYKKRPKPLFGPLCAAYGTVGLPTRLSSPLNVPMSWRLGGRKVAQACMWPTVHTPNTPLSSLPLTRWFVRWAAPRLQTQILGARSTQGVKRGQLGCRQGKAQVFTANCATTQVLKKRPQPVFSPPLLGLGHWECQSGAWDLGICPWTATWGVSGALQVHMQLLAHTPNMPRIPSKVPATHFQLPSFRPRAPGLPT